MVIILSDSGMKYHSVVNGGQYRIPGNTVEILMNSNVMTCILHLLVSSIHFLCLVGHLEVESYHEGRA